MPYLISGLLIGLVVGFAGGWIQAHQTVATECEKLGSFYVGDKVYECKLREGAKQ